MNKKPVKPKECFEEYTREISVSVINEFGGSYQNYDTIGDTWRSSFPYTPETENYLIEQTNVLLMVIPSIENSNLTFYKAFIDKIVNYLSEYTKKSISKAQGNRQELAKAQLLNQLFEENPMIIHKAKQTKIGREMQKQQIPVSPLDIIKQLQTPRNK